MTVELSAGGVPSALPGARRMAGRAHADDTIAASDPQARSFRYALAEAQPEPAPKARASADTKDLAATARRGREPAPARADTSNERNGQGAANVREMPDADQARGARDGHGVGDASDAIDARNARYPGNDEPSPRARDAQDAVATGSLPGPADPALALAQAGLLSAPTPMPLSPAVLPPASVVSGAGSMGGSVADLVAAATASAAAGATASGATDATDAISIAISNARVETGPWTPPGAGSPLPATPGLVPARARPADGATGAPPASFTITSAVMNHPTPATLLLQRGAMGDGRALATGAVASAGATASGLSTVASGVAAGSGMTASDAVGPGGDATGWGALAALDATLPGLGAGAAPIDSLSRRGARPGAGGEVEGTAAQALSGSGASSGPAFAAPASAASMAPAGAAEPGATALLDAFGWWMSQKTQAAELTLDVGGQPVSVSVKVQGNEAQVVFRSDAPEARQALAQALPQLREMLGGEGLVLAGASVADHGDGGAAGRERAGTPAPASAGSGGRGGEPRAGADGATPVPGPRAAAGARALDLYV